jgi:predicted nucleotidyltransferase component of viral defense system
MIPQRNISLLSNRLADAGRRIREDVLERDYCLAWFLAVLAESDLNALLAFKGGTALKRCYIGDYRFSEDLDFTLTTPISCNDILSRLGPVYTRIREESGIVFAFDREDRQSHTNSYTFYLKYEGPLPAGNNVKVDVTIREHLAFPLNQRVVLRAYPEFTDIPEDRRLQVYSLDEIATEKVLALADLARNEPRDLYDLWYLTSRLGVELEPLVGAMRDKLEFRGRIIEGIGDAIVHKEARLRALWSGRLANQMASLPPFEEVFRVVRRTLRQANLP